MPVKIRLTRLGKKNAPQYRIVAVDSRRKRDGAFLENLGAYNPLTGKIEQFHLERIEDWVSKGAVLTEPVHRLKKEYLKSTKAK